VVVPDGLLLSSVASEGLDKLGGFSVFLVPLIILLLIIAGLIAYLMRLGKTVSNPTNRIRTSVRKKT
jgi:Na+/serine symporter